MRVEIYRKKIALSICGQVRVQNEGPNLNLMKAAARNFLIEQMQTYRQEKSPNSIVDQLATLGHKIIDKIANYFKPGPQEQMKGPRPDSAPEPRQRGPGQGR